MNRDRQPWRINNLTDQQVAERTILPQQQRGGRLIVNNMNIALNRSIQVLSRRKRNVSQLENRYFNGGGVSNRLFGKRIKF